MAHYPPTSRMLSIPYLGSRLALSSRWEYSGNGAIWSAWAGSTISFFCSSPLSSLSMRIGPKTERKDRWNGRTALFAVSVRSSASSSVIETKTFEAEPATLVQLWDEPIEDCFVEITLIDWASILEIDGFVSEYAGIFERRTMPSDPPILFIGDSLTCGLALDASVGGHPIPRGVLDAFPSRTICILREKHSYQLSLEISAYPGIALVGLGPQGENHGETSGMADKFFMTSPWNAAAWTPCGNPKFICIALGTNDEANDVASDVFRSSLERFIRKLWTTFPSVKAFYIVPPFRDFNEPDAGEIYNDLVSRPVVVDDLFIKVCTEIKSGMTADHTVDGLHPTVAGHNLLAENLAQFLLLQRPPAVGTGRGKR
ncbi:SGNH hydrolase-type esterase domain-containing protein [Mycena vitilis]|nr:SGNH hydrolase-type esterase domain-containing protein [Mycena vitilis]